MAHFLIWSDDLAWRPGMAVWRGDVRRPASSLQSVSAGFGVVGFWGGGAGAGSPDNGHLKRMQVLWGAARTRLRDVGGLVELKWGVLGSWIGLRVPGECFALRLGRGRGGVAQSALAPDERLDAMPGMCFRRHGFWGGWGRLQARLAGKGWQDAGRRVEELFCFACCRCCVVFEQEAYLQMA